MVLHYLKIRSELEKEVQSPTVFILSKMSANALLEWHLCVLGYVYDFQNLEVGENLPH